jgi:hypothetical protein
MRLADLITASFLMLLGGVALYDAVRLGIGWADGGPESGFFPFWLAVVLVVVSVGIIVQAVRRASPASFVTWARLVPVLQVLVPVAVTILLMEFAGLYVACALYIAFSMRWGGGYSWPSVVVIAVGIPVVAFFVFEKWFLVPMPKGPLEAWLGY